MVKQKKAEWIFCNVRLTPALSSQLEELAKSDGRTKGGLIKHWISTEAQKAGIVPPKGANKETKNAATQ